MSEVKRKYVIPGELVAEGSYRNVSNIFRVEQRYYSTRIGLAEVLEDSVRVIPLSGPYFPRVDDLVIGKITDYSAFAWEVDISACLPAFLPAQSVFGREYSPARDSLTNKFAVGDLIVARIAAFDRTRDPLLTVSDNGLGLVSSGEVVKISPIKVPRVIGKKGTMIKTIESGTNCRLTVGQNGLIVIDGSAEGILKAASALRLIEEEAHIADLNQKVQELISKTSGVERNE
ncbi:MAG TPA: exosome complex RNA-binding protein Rrp4 [Nitrososphaerales archaeon]